MKYFIIALLLPYFAFAQYQIDSTSNTNIGYVNNSVSKIERPVASAYAPHVSAGQCLHSVSAGGSILEGGISFGFNKDSTTCFALLYAAMFPNDVKMQKAIFCQTKLMRVAYKEYGEPCLQKAKTIKYEYPISKGGR